MRTLRAGIGTALVATSLAAASAPAAEGTSATQYSAAVTRICAGAVLFENPHEMGTRADALAVARDIEASTAGRLARVVAVPVPPVLREVSGRWVSSQSRLAAVFARTWVEVYDAIAAAKTPAQQAALPRRLRELVHAPDALRLLAGRLELKLHVPDCTGD